MRVWRIEVEYEGTRYAGWQAQPHARTVQGELTKAAGQFLNARVEVGGSGRTDAGVHALRQVAHLKTKTTGRAPDPVQLKTGLNKLLPHDVNVLRVGVAPASFHARHDARALLRLPDRDAADGVRQALRLVGAGQAGREVDEECVRARPGPARLQLVLREP